MAGEWASTAGPMAQRVRAQTERCLAAYRENPRLVDEHANIELSTAQGGYGRRQTYELIQNGADAMLRKPGGRIHILLTAEYLYCANQGEAIGPDGVDAILGSHLSVKRGNEIGRFGLGFKSVLGVTTEPQFFSRSVSFGFSRLQAEQRIRRIVPSAERVPILRTASVLDPKSAANHDETLATLMEWAMTVVRLPLEGKARDWLADDVRRFPAEFLLFAPHVGELVLEDRAESRIRRIRASENLGVQLVGEGDEQTSWRVFIHDHVPTADARADAGELAARESLPVIWAVPLAGRQVRGQFWAFFPVEFPTTLSGIINAPWKTNEDRQTLLHGVFNEELVQVASRLVVQSLPELTVSTDPGRLLDILPARGREAPNWADQALTDSVYQLAADSPSIPNQRGELAVPRELWLHPEGVPPEALEAWSSALSAPTDWCHKSVETRERRSRVERLVGDDRIATLTQWVEALIVPGDPDSSSAAIRAAAAVLRTSPESEAHVRRAKIVLTTRGEMVPADARLVFLGPAGDDELEYVHPNLESDAATLSALRELSIGSVEPIGQLKSLVIRSGDGIDWNRFWQICRAADPALLASAITELSVLVHVRTLDGNFTPVPLTLLPGPIVPGDGSRDASVAIDPNFHDGDAAILLAFGAMAAPRADGGSTTETWFRQYRRAAVRAYEEELSRRGGRRPNLDYIDPEVPQFAGPIEPLANLSEEGRRRFTESLLATETSLEPVAVAHRTQRQAYPIVPFPHPIVWRLRTEGVFQTSVGLRSTAQLVSPRFSEWREFLPVPDVTEPVASHLGLPNEPVEVPAAVWTDALECAAAREHTDRLGDFYALVAAQGIGPPSSLRARVGQSSSLVERDRVFVATTETEVDALAEQTRPMLVATQDAAKVLSAAWGLRPAAEAVRTEVAATPLTEPSPLVDEFPALRPHLPLGLREMKLVRCSELRREFLSERGKSSEEADVIIDADSIYWRENGKSQLDLLRYVRDEFGLELNDEDLQDVIRHRALQHQRDLILRMGATGDLIEKFLIAVPLDAVRRRLPGSLPVEDAERLSPRDTAELAHAIYGVDLLREFRLELQTAGLNPPTNWAGSRAARTFVRHLGFPIEYAGFEHEARDAVVRVDGPPGLPSLHDFQKEIKAKVRILLRERRSRRGLLSLPTGAGKTRIAVEAIVDATREEELASPVLWIAQTDELCEQAVQAWTDAWRAFGPRVPLRIGRLWSGNEVDQYPTGPQVVVATIAKLGSGTMADPSYQWLAESSCVVVDEAHASIGPQYTETLRWLGLGRTREDDRCSLLGLTATPFRGTSVEETERLAARYNKNRMDHDVLPDDQYKALQEMGVLAKVHHELLPGSDIKLSEDELVQLEKLRRLPSSVEMKLGANPERNRRILDSISGLPDDWTTLVFATSVDNAELLAALLTLRRVPAAVVSAKTDPGARRHYIREFRNGNLRVLTNYGVLAEGFDAPSVRAVYVTRPTYSPNVYQQMIGRGLRGPLNGGKERCLIVNVADNVAQFGEELAFTQFEHLWNPS